MRRLAAVALSWIPASCRTSAAPANTADDSQLRIVALQHMRADEMAATLSEFLAQDAQARGEAEAVDVRAHQATNSILIRGRPDRIEDALARIGRLDVVRR